MTQLKFSDLVKKRADAGNVTNNKDDVLKCCLTSSTVVPVEFNNMLDAIAVTGSKYDADYVTGCGKSCNDGDTTYTHAATQPGKGACQLGKKRAYCMRGKEGDNNRWYWAGTDSDFVKNAKVCPRGFRDYTSSGCKAKIEDYCKKDENLFKAECQQFCANNSEKCVAYKSDYCNSADRKDDSNCISWCLTEEGQGKCDKLFAERCSDEENDKDNPECNCIFSKIKKYNPYCVDAKCANTGYVTTNMKSQICPNIVDCSVYNEIGEVGRDVQWKDNSIVQKCSSKTDTTNVNQQPDDSNSDPAPEEEKKDDSPAEPAATTKKLDDKTKQIIMWVGIGLGILILLIVVIIIARGGKRPAPVMYYR